MTEPVRIHLVDGTFELFRCFHGAPRATNEAGLEVGAARGLLATITALVHRPEVTHVAVAFDSVVAPPPSARGGKPTGMLSGDQLISAQAGLAAESVRSLGIRVWPSGRYQADEMIATGAARYAADPTVCQVVICSTDNDFNQCVRGSRIVVLDRIRNVVTDEDAVVERYGVAPSQLPDLFALVGDRSDGLPGVPGWGLRSAAEMLRRYGSLEAMPVDERLWDVAVRGAPRLAAALREWRDEALMCRDLAELRTDLPLRYTVADLAWRGADRARLDRVCRVLGDDSVISRIERWVA
ncbi:MAG TPA: 5'-3' exonuclease H3TH domain-containing protein [Ilumatobacteraceae bacterium]